MSTVTSRDHDCRGLGQDKKVFILDTACSHWIQMNIPTSPTRHGRKKFISQESRIGATMSIATVPNCGLRLSAAVTVVFALTVAERCSDLRTMTANHSFYP